MNRHYSVNETFEKLNYLNRNIQNLNLGADIIVGFPGENEEDFQITVNNLKKMPLSYFHVFPYSPRKFTRAAEFPEQIPDEIKKQRVKILKEIADEKQQKFLLDMLEIPQKVLIEKSKKETNLYKGVSSNYIKFLIESEKNISNNVIEIIGYEIRNKKILAKINNL